MIHVLCETDGDVHAVGQAHMWGDLFPGAPWQVVRVRPGAVPSRSAYPGGNPNPACVWCSALCPGDEDPVVRCGCIVPCAAGDCEAKGKGRNGLQRPAMLQVRQSAHAVRSAW